MSWQFDWTTQFMDSIAHYFPETDFSKPLPPFSEGTIIWKNHDLFRAKSNIPPKMFDPLDWDEVILSDEIGSGGSGPVHINWAPVANNFNEGSIYDSEHPYVMKDGFLYKIKEGEIKNPGPWDESKFDLTNVGRELVECSDPTDHKKWFAEPWSSTMHYKYGDLVIYDDELWFCNPSPWSTDENGFVVGVTPRAGEWNKLSRQQHLTVLLNRKFNQQNVADEFETYDHSAGYAVGDIVTFKGDIFECIQALGTHNDGYPDPAHWKKIKLSDMFGGSEESNDIAREFDPAWGYNAGDLVYHTVDGVKKLYSCIWWHASGEWEDVKDGFVPVTVADELTSKLDKSTLGKEIRHSDLGTQNPGDIKIFQGYSYIAKNNNPDYPPDPGVTSNDTWLWGDKYGLGKFINSYPSFAKPLRKEYIWPDPGSGEPGGWYTAEDYHIGDICYEINDDYHAVFYKARVEEPVIAPGGDGWETQWEFYDNYSKLLNGADSVKYPDIAPMYVPDETYKKGDMVYWLDADGNYHLYEMTNGYIRPGSPTPVYSDGWDEITGYGEISRILASSTDIDNIARDFNNGYIIHAGEFVNFRGKIWRSKIENPSWPFDSDQWDEVIITDLLGDSDGALMYTDFADFYNPTINYHYGDYCLHVSPDDNKVHLWKLYDFHSSGAPGTDAGGTWSDMTDAGAISGEITDKVKWEAVLDSFSEDPTTIYEVGDLVYLGNPYGAQIFKCNTATTGGDMDFSKWDAIKLVDLITDANGEVKYVDVAPEFDSTAYYQYGDVVYKTTDGVKKLYVYNDFNGSSGEFDPGKWGQIDIARELEDKTYLNSVATKWTGPMGVYNNGTIVYAGGRFYKSLKDSNIEMLNDPTAWKQGILSDLIKGDGEVKYVDVAVDFDPNVYYNYGDIVYKTIDGVETLCVLKADSTVGAFDPDKWWVVSVGEELKNKAYTEHIASVYNGGTEYHEGDIVYQRTTGRFFRSNSDNNDEPLTNTYAWTQAPLADLITEKEKDLVKYRDIAQWHDDDIAYHKGDLVYKTIDGETHLYRLKELWSFGYFVPDQWEEIDVYNVIKYFNDADKNAIAKNFHYGHDYNEGDIVWHAATREFYKALVDNSEVDLDDTDTWKTDSLYKLIDGDSEVKYVDITEDYDTEMQYFYGDIVYKTTDGVKKIYMCTSNDGTDGEFDPSKWMHVDIADVIERKTDLGAIARKGSSVMPFAKNEIVWDPRTKLFYKSLKDENDEPFTDTTAWKGDYLWKLIDGGGVKGETLADPYNAWHYYYPSELKSEDDKLYVCTASASDPDDPEFTETTVEKQFERKGVVRQFMHDVGMYDAGEVWRFDNGRYAIAKKANNDRSQPTESNENWEVFYNYSELVRWQQQQQDSNIAPEIYTSVVHTPGYIGYYNGILYKGIVPAGEDTIPAGKIPGVDTDYWQPTTIAVNLGGAASDFRTAFNAAMSALGSVLGFTHHFEKRGTDTENKDYFDFN